MTAWLAKRLAAMIPSWPRCRLVVALSGGVDSVALLHLLVQLRATPACRGRLRLRAVHVDHHLQSASGEWRAQCQRIANVWRVPLTICDATIHLKKGESLEAAAREARYALLQSSVAAGDILLTAQHQDDQLETVLLQLLRGAGPAGLAGMFEVGTLGANQMLRPLLTLPRTQLLRYAQQHKLSWIDDPSNSDLRFDRNYLRARVLPALRERWPSAAATVSRSARHLAEAAALLTVMARSDLAAISCGDAIALASMAALSPARQRAVTRLWLTQRGCSTPDEVHLARIVSELPAARADANPLVRWPGGEVRRYRGLLLVVPVLPPRGTAFVWDWRRSPRLLLGPGLGYLQIRRAADGDWARASLPKQFTVAFRVGGERVAAGGQHRKLKELLRVAGVVPWMRGHMPVVSAAGEVWSVPGVWRRSASAARGRGTRVSVEWIDAPNWRVSNTAI